ncbi:MAG: M14 family zinc carboxypeptidase [Candidatus Hodarchaeota archaeon]
MKKFAVTISLTLGLLLLLNSILLINTIGFYKITNSTEELFIPSKKRTKIVYPFIWEEFIGAPGNQIGDDSMVFGSSFGPYHNYTELVTKLKSLNTTFPEIIDLFSIGKTYFGRDIFCVKITNESILLPKTEVLIVGQHHAREQITVENALYFIDKVVDNWMRSDSSIEVLLKTKVVYVIPSLNIDGAEVMSQFPWQRKTARPIDEDNDNIKDEDVAFDTNQDGYIDAIWENLNGNWNFIGYEGTDRGSDGKIGYDMPGGVDANRNYPYEFGNLMGASDDPFSEVYHGPEAFSENCTARFRDFALQRNFITAASLHSGIDVIIGPWSYSDTLVTGIDSNMYINVGMELQKLTGLAFLTEFGYPASGEWGDWMYGRRNGTLLEFTFETYGGETESFYNNTTGFYHNRGVWDAFNPPADKVIDNCAQVYPGLLFMAKEAPYLSIQADSFKIKDNIHIKVNVTNPSSFVRTNGSIILEFTASQVNGLTLLNATNIVNLEELEARSSTQVSIIFSINEPDYSVHIDIQVDGPKVGKAVAELDLDPSTILATKKTPSFTSLIAMAGILALIPLILIRKKRLCK